MIDRYIDEIKVQIDKIKSIDLRSVVFSSLLDEIIILMKEYTCVQFPASNNEVYRVRINKKGETGEFELYAKVENLWAPKSEDMPMGKFGRTNKPQEPVFYCSSSYEAAISESSVQEGDWITIMSCQSKENLSAMKTVGFGFLDKAEFKTKDGKESIYWGKYKQEHITNNYRDEYRMKEKVEECSSKNNLIDEFLNKEFRRKIDSDNRNFEYKITVAIASLFLDNPNLNSVRFDGIYYPTIYSSTSFSNLALTVKAASEFYKPIYFETIEIGKIIRENNKIQYCGSPKFKSVEVTQSGDIRWRRE